MPSKLDPKISNQPQSLIPTIYYQFLARPGPLSPTLRRRFTSPTLNITSQGMGVGAGLLFFGFGCGGVPYGSFQRGYSLSLERKHCACCLRLSRSRASFSCFSLSLRFRSRSRCSRSRFSSTTISIRNYHRRRRCVPGVGSLGLLTWGAFWIRGVISRGLSDTMHRNKNIIAPVYVDTLRGSLEIGVISGKV